MRKLNELPSGSRVAVDANIVLYHFTGRSMQCSDFLNRARSGEITAFLPAHIGLELLHRLMMLEAVVSGVSTSGSPAKKLSTNPESVRRLQRSFRDFQCLEMLGLSLIDTSVAAVERATWYCMNYGLLANDAALLAVMEKAELSNLATCDKQLQDIPPFQAWTAIDL